MRTNLKWFLVAELLLLAVALLVDGPQSPTGGFIICGIASGQAALLGLWWALGAVALLRRTKQAALGIVALMIVLAVGSTLNGWMVLLIAMRLLVVGGVFYWMRGQRGLMLSKEGSDVGLTVFQLGIKHLLAITLAVAVFFALVRIQDAGGSDVALALIVVMWGVGMAAGPLLAAMAAFARRSEVSAACALVLVIVAVAAANASFAYMQTSRANAAFMYFCWLLLEAAVVAGSALGLRAIGYRLTADHR